ncbi:hypothetical protein J2772_004744 [Chryseobacterium jejuense]|nr:hypothetical protein [Chryseobacterium jejuense]
MRITGVVVQLTIILYDVLEIYLLKAKSPDKAGDKNTNDEKKLFRIAN